MTRPVRHHLQPHESSGALAQGTAIAVEIATEGSGLRLRYRLAADRSLLRIPPRAPSPARTDGLWRHTCFEAFVGDGSGEYAEFNFSPSGNWAAYRFTGYREGMVAPATAREPLVSLRPGGDVLELEAVVDIDWLRPAPGVRRRLGLATVLEHASGELSYWALAHPPGKPDFHHADGFVIELG